MLKTVQEALNERLPFLTALSKKPIARERLQKAILTRHPSVSGGSCKCKLALTPTKKLTDAGPPCKRQRTFTNAASELVKICSAYMQGQAALLSKPQLPEKVMESVLIRFEQASSRKMTVTSAVLAPGQH